MIRFLSEKCSEQFPRFPRRIDLKIAGFHCNECVVERMDKVCSKQEATLLDQSFSFSCQSRKSIDENLDDQCQYIDMDLGMRTHWEAFEADKMLRKSKDYEEFEFTMASLNLTLLEPKQAAPADELFYKGKLLPLQPDPRFQLVQTLSSTGKIERETEMLSQKLSSRLVGEENMTSSSSRFDRMTLHNNLMDSRCSSSRSQNSGFWESGEKDTGDSSSSRDSNGSSQDSCYRAERGTSPPLPKSQSHKIQNQSVSRSPFSWKSLFRSLKKAPKFWADDRDQKCSRLRSDNYKQKRQTYLPSMLSFGKASSKQDSSTQHSNNVDRTTLQTECTAREKSKISAEGQVPNQSTEWNTIASSVKPHAQIDKDKHRTSWHSKERWRRYVKMLRPLYVKISQKHDENGSFGQLRMDNCGRALTMDGHVASVHSPLERKASQAYSLSLHSDSTYSSRYLTVASCPVSMRSSPNHSGVLAVLDKGTSSTTQEFHSAIQSAIAHCKQSQVGNQ
eukprot:c22260_g1_i2 orf=845-2356(+)